MPCAAHNCSTFLLSKKTPNVNLARSPPSMNNGYCTEVHRVCAEVVEVEVGWRSHTNDRLAPGANGYRSGTSKTPPSCATVWAMYPKAADADSGSSGGGGVFPRVKGGRSSIAPAMASTCGGGGGGGGGCGGGASSVGDDIDIETVTRDGDGERDGTDGERNDGDDGDDAPPAVVGGNERTTGTMGNTRAS